MLRRWLAVLLAATTMGTIAACGGGESGSDSSGPIKIGVMNPFSGDFALYGEEVTRGYQLAVDEVNAKGGVNGRKIELVRGDATTADDAVSQAERLGTREDVAMFTGTYISAVANTASDTAARQKKFYWETNALANELTTRKLENYVRVGPRAADFAQVSTEGVPAVAKALGKPVGQLRVFIEHEDSIYGSSVAKDQEAQMKKAGVNVVGTGKHAAAASDVSDSILKAKQAKPDMWINTGYVPDTTLLLRTARSQGFNPAAKMLIGTGDTKETLEAIGASRLRGTLVVSYPGGKAGVSEKYGPGSAAFLKAYKKKYKSDPRAPQSLTAFAGMKTLIKVLGQTKGNTEVGPIREKVDGLDEPDSTLPTGYGVKLDKDGQNQRAKPVITQWRGKQTVTVFPSEAAGGRSIADLGG